MTFRILKMLTLLHACALAACSDVPDNAAPQAVHSSTGSQPASSAHSSLYKAALLSAISKADKIVIIEHSDRYDGMDNFIDGKPDPQPLPIVTYHTLEMSAVQRHMFASRVGATPADEEESIPACIFQPRHTIQFYSGATLISTMRICFQCSQSTWDGSPHNPPRDINAALKDVIIEMGLTPERDWDELRLSHRKRSST